MIFSNTADPYYSSDILDHASHKVVAEVSLGYYKLFSVVRSLFTMDKLIV